MLIIIILGNYLILRGYTTNIIDSTLQSNLDLLYVRISDARQTGAITGLTREESMALVLSDLKNLQLRVGRIKPVVFSSEGEVLFHPYLFRGDDISDREYFKFIKSNRYGQITYSSNLDLTQTESEWKQNQILVYKYFKPWDIYIGIIDIESFYVSGIQQTALYSVLIALISILLLFIITKITVSRILSPIKILTETASEYGAGKLTRKVEIESGDEIEILGNTFNKMSDDLKRHYDEVVKSKDQMHQTLSQLSESEKLATIGGLVSGLTHDLMTPLGISLTASSYLNDNITEIREAIEGNKLKKSDFIDFLDKAADSSKITLNNLHRAAEMTRSFKQIAVDQGSADLRRFNVKTYVETILSSLQPKFKGTKHRVTLNCHSDIEIYSYPGAYSQVLTNLLLNSLIHGFEGIRSGEILIDIKVDEKQLYITYSDNGCGMTKESLKSLYDPYFTTKKDSGGTGMGTHLIYNIVTKTLEGKIECQSSLNSGTTYEITIPLSHETDHF